MKLNAIKLAISLLSVFFLLSFSSNTKLTGESESYFPLNIKEKKITWFNTQYTEKQIGEKKFFGKTYKIFEQKWTNGKKDLLYLREENGVIYQYEKLEKNHETVRYDHKFKKRKTWGPSIKPKLYKVKTYKGTLVTPHGKYTNLMVIEARFDNGKFKFYYKKGIGYIGATTRKGGLVSYLKE